MTSHAPDAVDDVRLLDPVASLHTFVQTWTGTTQCSEAANIFSRFPPPLAAPLPRSFRPCEMLPGLYLGSAQDIGTDAAALISRLHHATTTNKNNAPAAAPPQHMTLLVRACPLHGVTEPQVELHVTRGRRTGLRGGPSTVSTRQRANSAATTVRVGKLSGAPSAEPLVPVHDVEVMTLTVAKLYERVCAVVGRTVPPARSDAVAQWLSPAAGDTQQEQEQQQSSVPSSMKGRGAVPPDFSSADWAAFVFATQDVLLGDDCTEAMRSVPPFLGSDVQRYWRLVLPLLDLPSAAIQPHFAMTTLLIHAALSLHEHPRWAEWSARHHRGTDEKATGEAPAGSCVADEVGNERVREDVSSTTPTAMPCVVVHCLAGKSRSVSFVAAFILQEWMMWYRTTHPPSQVMSAESSSTAVTAATPVRHDATPRRLVDAVMAHLRSRRLCVSANLGFDGQLVSMMNAFVNTVRR